jgi:hypothetical protein
MPQILLVIVGAILGKLTEKLFEAFAKRRQRQFATSIAGPEDVSAWKWNGVKLLTKLIELDKRLIGDSLTDSREGTAKQWASIFVHHPHSWALLVNGPKHIVGYWHFAPLRDEVFAKAKSGDLLDSEILFDTVETLDVPGHYNLYFVLIGILPEHQVGFGKLIDEFFSRIESLAERGIFFREVCANAFTRQGKRLCEGFGMEKVCDHHEFGVVYLTALAPWPHALRHKRWENLAEMYEREFGPA